MTTGIYNTRFIYYNDAGEIQAIRPFPPEDDQLLFFEIDFALVEEFLFGNKSYTNYKINYFLNLVNGIINEEETVISEEQQFLHIVPTTSSFNNEITIIHTPSSWNIKVRDDVIEKVRLFSKLEFFVCKKDDPSFLHSKFTVDLNNLSSIEFVTEDEKDLNLISVVTSKKFKSYGIRKIYE
jgi:hypothetical protein